MNKRGQGLSTTAIILIILGLVVLAALIYYFVLGGKNLQPYLSTGNNVQTVVTQCSTYCSTASKYDFCTKQMTVNANSKAYNGTCNDLARGVASIPGAKKGTYTKADVSDVNSFNIASCPTISCS